MTKNELNGLYFEWLYELVRRDDRFRRYQSYRKLLRHLHDIEFAYTIPMDGNRAEDGIGLRYRFGDAYSYDDRMIASLLDDQPCSVLEMMIALAIRCEEHIMTDTDIGDRTAQWFWDMITNLDLCRMDDIRFDQRYVDSVIERLLNREYERDGSGGLFTTDQPEVDMRSLDIWYQMCWYLKTFV